MQNSFGPHLRQDIHKIDKVYIEEQQGQFNKSETTAAANDSRTWNSSALYKKDLEDN